MMACTCNKIDYLEAAGKHLQAASKKEFGHSSESGRATRRTKTYSFVHGISKALLRRNLRWQQTVALLRMFGYTLVPTRVAQTKISERLLLQKSASAIEGLFATTELRYLYKPPELFCHSLVSPSLQSWAAAMKVDASACWAYTLSLSSVA